jgi:stage II sporulation protein D
VRLCGHVVVAPPVLKAFPGVADARTEARRGERTINSKALRCICAATITAMTFAMFGARPALAAGDPLPSDLKLIMTGGGWGHGHGMSQYGARAQAEAGRTWQQILHSYYTGVSITDRGNESLRVLVDSGTSVAVGGPETYTAKWAGGATIASNSATYPYMRVRATSEGVAVDRAANVGGPWSQFTTGTRSVYFYPSGSIMPVLEGSRIRYYRGYIAAYRRGSTTMYAINHLTMDRYLYGVVPREMPAGWHSVGLRAQAVAARSYSAWKKNNASSTSSYDICATTQCQVYGGYGYRESPSGPIILKENSRTNDAVNATSGMTMVSGGEPIFAEFHSSSGGHTSQGSRPYLAPVADPWDEVYSPHYRWTGVVPVSQIEAHWPAIGRLVSISNIVRDGDGPWGGRFVSLRLNGTAGYADLTGGSLPSAFSWPTHSSGLRSRLFSIGIFDATQYGTIPEVRIQPGASAPATVRLTNTGTRTWKVGSVVQLGTAGPLDRTSTFRADTWTAATRPGFLTSDATGDGVVGAGEVGTFTFELTAPAGIQSGTYTETFRPVAAGLTWFGSPITVPIRIGTDGGTQLGGNIVQNASFEGATGAAPSLWSPRNVRTGDGVVAGGVDGARSVKLSGTRGTTVAVVQPAAARGRIGDRLILSGWNRASNTSGPGGSIELRVTATFNDGAVKAYTAAFPRTPHGWTFVEKAFVVEHSYQSLTIAARASDQSGTVWFDRIRVARERVVDPSFESGSAWQLANAASTDGRTFNDARAGVASLRLSARSDATVYARQALSNFSVPAGTRLRIGGWSRTVGTSPTMGAVMVVARLTNVDGTIESVVVQYPRDDHDWRYAESVFTAKKDVKSAIVYSKVSRQSGRAWFDDLTFAPAPTVHSLDDNAGFEVGGPAAWKFTSNVAANPVVSTAASGAAALRIDGDSTKIAYANQMLPLAGAAGDTFLMSAYNRTVGTSPDGGTVRAWLRVVYEDGSVAWPTIEFSATPHDWVRAERTWVASKPFVSIEVFAGMTQQSGDAYFDDVRLTPVVS